MCLLLGWWDSDSRFPFITITGRSQADSRSPVEGRLGSASQLLEWPVLWVFWGLGIVWTWGFGDLGTWGFGDLGTWGFGDLKIWRFADMRVWRSRDSGSGPLLHLWCALTVFTLPDPQIPKSPNPQIPKSPNPQIPKSPSPQIPKSTQSPNPKCPQDWPL